MNCLIVLALASVAQAQSLLPLDTAEVNTLKAAHFAEHAIAAARVGAPLQDVYKTIPASLPASFAPAPVVSPEGFLSDTPEVAAARAAHLAEHARATVEAYAAYNPLYADYYRAFYNYYYPQTPQTRVYTVYTGPQAVPTVLPSGYLADTPEVAHAKATHLYKHYQEANRL